MNKLVIIGDSGHGKVIADIIKKGGKDAILEAIGGPVCHSGFARLLD